jgi:hypothetical protein
MRCMVTVVVGLLLVLSACDVPNARASRAQEEMAKRLTDDPEFMAGLLTGSFGLDRGEIRKLAAEHVAIKYQGCSILGTQTIAFDSGLYFVGVDMGCKKSSPTLNLTARKFVRPGDKHETYWKVEPMNGELSGLMLGALIKKSGRQAD